MQDREIFLKIKNLTKRYYVTTSTIRGTRFQHIAVKDVSLNIFNHECLALVGESGSGKTTLGKCIIRLVPADNGSVLHKGVNLLQMPENSFRHFRPKFQMIYQNHSQALNPRQSVGTCLKEPLKIHGSYRKESLTNRIKELLALVQLDESLIFRYPNELSGGQRQRVAIARALAPAPIFLIADEPTSSLDATIKHQIVELLTGLRYRLGLTLLLISHDLAMVSYVSDRIAVMYKGEVLELAPTKSLIISPVHPYSKLLVASANYEVRDQCEKLILDSPDIENKGCVYSFRCPWAESICFHEKPILRPISDDHLSACHLVEKIDVKFEVV